MHTTDPCTLLPPVDPLFTLCTRGVFVMCVSMSVLYPRRCPAPPSSPLPPASRVTRKTGGAVEQFRLVPGLVPTGSCISRGC